MSDRRYFGTDGVRGVAGIHPMTATFALRLGMALAETVRARTGDRPRLLIGMDTRRSGLMLAHAAAAGMTARGADVTWLGVLPTPGVSFLTRALGADAGLMVSASHNPFDDNGLKLFNRDGEKLSDEVEARLEELVEGLAADDGAALARVVGDGVGSVSVAKPWDGNGASPGSKAGPLDLYVKHLLDNAPYLDGMRLVVDCAHGASHLIAPQLFAKLGARLEVINAEPDGSNINVGCGSTHPDALARHVVAGGFEVGVTFDGDADRALLVDSKGRVVTGDHMLAITALSRGEPGLVATQMSNLGTETFLKERGVVMHRAKVGDRYVFEELKKHGLKLGGEQSGHLLFLDKAPTGDGMLTALMTLAAVRKSGKPLEAWMDEIPVYPQVLKNVAVTPGTRDRVAAAPVVAAAVTAAETELGAGGRILLRPSGTEPLVRVMVEGSDRDQVERLADQVVAAVRSATTVGADA
ncbi:MAG: phosphoglucosamine mutase [Trueperaceae bacterium]|nr:phosphoglucosamine mutase [Trueperaceae bacterium]MCO5174826.1 phosphoglucosamine mutase [Trueperaceae bacterium]MCW5818622.1 phosphoglucosamine mutase [Trueperaceae bacterium]